jgi:uncharacterized membrane protein
MFRLGGNRLTTDMTLSPIFVLTTTTAIASAAVGGLFYAFSTFVMRGLDRTAPAQAITAMRGINAEAQANAPFLLLFVGSAVLAAALTVIALIQLRAPGSGYLLAGALLAIVAVVVTMAFNVPLNNQLDAVNPAALAPADAAREWANYLSTWTAWNHVRTVAPLLGSVLMLIGLRYR